MPSGCQVTTVSLGTWGWSSRNTAIHSNALPSTRRVRFRPLTMSAGSMRNCRTVPLAWLMALAATFRIQTVSWASALGVMVRALTWTTAPR